MQTQKYSESRKQATDWLKEALTHGHKLEDLQLQLIEKGGYPKELVDEIIAELRKINANTQPNNDNENEEIYFSDKDDKELVGNDGASAKTDKEFSRQDDVLTQENFKELEQEEQKKKPFWKKVFSKSDDEGKKTHQEKEKKLQITDMSLSEIGHAVNKMKSKLDDFMVDIGKNQGKISMVEENLGSTNERLIDLAQQIGDLRTTILDRERFFDKMETDFTAMKDAIASVKPEHIEKKFAGIEEDIIIKESQIEKNIDIIKYLKEQLKDIQDRLSAIGSFENISKIMNEIKEQRKIITEKEQKIDRIAVKTETFFYNIKEAADNIEENNRMIKGIEEFDKDVIKDIDKLQIKFSDTISKKQFEEVKDDLEVIKTEMFKKHLGKFKKKKEEK